MALRNRLQRRLDRAFDELLGGPGYIFSEEQEYLPLCDVEEGDQNYLVSFDLPGIKKDDVKIEIRDNLLTVSGERKYEHKERAQGRTSRERYYGTFSRSFTLPSNIDPEKVEANYENGVLQISMPKLAEPASKQIPIKEGKVIESKSTKAA